MNYKFPVDGKATLMVWVYCRWARWCNDPGGGDILRNFKWPRLKVVGFFCSVFNVTNSPVCDQSLSRCIYFTDSAQGQAVQTGSSWSRFDSHFWSYHFYFGVLFVCISFISYNIKKRGGWGGGWRGFRGSAMNGSETLWRLVISRTLQWDL